MVTLDRTIFLLVCVPLPGDLAFGCLSESNSAEVPELMGVEVKVVCFSMEGEEQVQEEGRRRRRGGGGQLIGCQTSLFTQ